jgi:hypothetical protein
MSERVISKRGGLGEFVLLGVCAFSIASVSPPALAVAASVVGVLASLWALKRDPVLVFGPNRLPLVLTVLVAASALSSGLTRIPPVGGAVFAVWLLVPVIAAWTVSRGRLIGAAPWLAIFAVTGVGLLVMAEHAESAVGIDVYFSHLEAADAIGENKDPYSDAVTVFDGRVGAPPDAVIEGYSYPPSTMWSYAISVWLTGDPRWLNVVAWLSVLVLIWTASSRADPFFRGGLLALLSLAPAWRLVVFTGWTEPLTLVLLALAAWQWRRRPIPAGIAFGLALASKQYMILLIPLLALGWRRIGGRQLIFSGVTATLALVPYLLVNAETYLEATVFRFLRSEYREDTLSLPSALAEFGLDPSLPIVLAAVVSAGVALLASRRVDSFGQLMLAATATMGTFFVLSQALTNYWFLLAGMAAIAAIEGSETNVDRSLPSRHEADPST